MVRGSEAVSLASESSTPSMSAAPEGSTDDFPWDSIGDLLDSQPVEELDAGLAIEICRASLSDPTPFIPDADVAAPSPIRLIQVSGLPLGDLSLFPALDPAEIVPLLAQAVLGAYGATHLGYYDFAVTLAHKAQFLMNAALSADASLLSVADRARSLGASMLLLWIFYLYQDDDNTNVPMVVTAYELVYRFEHQMSNSILLRVNLCRLAISETVEESSYWLERALAICSNSVRPKEFARLRASHLLV